MRDGIRIILARALKLRKNLRPVRAVMVEKLQQNRAVLKCAIHALPEEGDDGVGGVTDQERFCVHMPWRTFDRDHRAGRVVAKIVAKLRHQRYGVREICPERSEELRFGIEAG